MDTHVLEESCFWLLESVPNAILITDAAGRIVYTNSLAEELFGYSRGEPRGLAIECLLPQRHRHEYSFKPQQHTMGSGLKLFGQRKDGSEVAVDIDLSSLETTTGTMTMAAIRDLTWRDHSIEELQHTEAHLEHIIDSINDVVWSISPSGDRVLFVNSAWERVYGHPHIEAQNNPGLWQQTIHPEDRELVADSLATLLAKDQLDLEYRIVRPDGKVRWISDHATVVRDAQGVPVCIDGIGRDITQRKQVEEHQAVLMHELKSANEELKNFAYVVSHDLKAPLRAIGSLADWIATDYADKFDDEGREHLRLLVGRARRMDALIDGILQYSRVGHTQEGRTDVDLAALLHEVIDSLAPPTHIKIEIDTPLPTVHVERTRMQQVFQNLISNAIKYIDKPQGEIHVGCIPEKKTWKFYVRDNGPGIEQRHFVRIFQLFQTLMPRDRVESTGVGLALVKKIIELHDGSVWLESKVGEGSTFFFTLPKHGR
ncbi:MAG: PAS domain-containing sensor histidine kinase [Methylotenera sp.]